jgi:hypothetical protein
MRGALATDDRCAAGETQPGGGDGLGLPLARGERVDRGRCALLPIHRRCARVLITYQPLISHSSSTRPPCRSHSLDSSRSRSRSRPASSLRCSARRTSPCLKSRQISPPLRLTAFVSEAPLSSSSSLSATGRWTTNTPAGTPGADVPAAGRECAVRPRDQRRLRASARSCGRRLATPTGRRRVRRRPLRAGPRGRRRLCGARRAGNSARAGDVPVRRTLSLPVLGLAADVSAAARSRISSRLGRIYSHSRGHSVWALESP